MNINKGDKKKKDTFVDIKILEVINSKNILIVMHLNGIYISLQRYINLA